MPSDGAMEAYRELEEEWDQNYRLWEYVQKMVHDLDNAILQGELSYVNVVWRGAHQSMLDWHSPPSWYEVPQTFHQWYRDAEERGGAIFEAGQAVRMMRLTRNELDRIRSIALDTHEEIKESLEEMDPVTGMDSQLRSLFGGLGWARFAEGGRCLRLAG